MLPKMIFAELMISSIKNKMNYCNISIKFRSKSEFQNKNICLKVFFKFLLQLEEMKDYLTDILVKYIIKLERRTFFKSEKKCIKTNLFIVRYVLEWIKGTTA